MSNSHNILSEIKELLKSLIAKQEAIELEQKQHLDIIFQIAREQLTIGKTEDHKQENDIVLAVKDLLNTTQTLPHVVVEQNRGQINRTMISTMKDFRSDMVNIIETITQQLQDILKELKIDPDNPKPIELRTEENSKQILALNEQITPLVVKIQQPLEKLDSVISKMSKALS